MDSLKWHQDSSGLHVMVDCPDFSVAEFSISNSHINFLLAGTPRLYQVFVKMNDSDTETSFLLDLDKLRPVINKTNGLKISLARKKVSANVASGNVVGRYCLARGESYHERFLSDLGWQSQRVYLDIYAKVSDNKANTETAINNAINIKKDEPASMSDMLNDILAPAKPKQSSNDFDDLDLDLSDGSDSSLNFF